MIQKSHVLHKIEDCSYRDEVPSFSTILERPDEKVIE